MMMCNETDPISLRNYAKDAIVFGESCCYYTFLSWEPSYRPTVIQALQHPFFHSCYCIPPTVRLQDTSFTLLDSVPLVFKMAMQCKLMKKTPSSKSCASSLERVDFNEDLSHFLPKDLFV
ncbi:protein kinase-like domain-containing protein [Artemisia annua]|uniref:Protein kinase-like domain-containing protein n=1 Tax=Artemisia annua TaxID=35608 RepID=A0A2U1KAG6_ARTAN|nr:protein kinase-like domain-containing protein [Artemisia annua]